MNHSLLTALAEGWLGGVLGAVLDLQRSAFTGKSRRGERSREGSTRDNHETARKDSRKHNLR